MLIKWWWIENEVGEAWSADEVRPWQPFGGYSSALTMRKICVFLYEKKDRLWWPKHWIGFPDRFRIRCQIFWFRVPSYRNRFPERVVSKTLENHTFLNINNVNETINIFSPFWCHICSSLIFFILYIQSEFEHFDSSILNNQPNFIIYYCCCTLSWRLLLQFFFVSSTIWLGIIASEEIGYLGHKLKLDGWMHQWLHPKDQITCPLLRRRNKRWSNITWSASFDGSHWRFLLGRSSRQWRMGNGHTVPSSPQISIKEAAKTGDGWGVISFLRFGISFS